MNSRTLIHICLAGLFALAVLYIAGRWNSPEWQENPMYPFMGILALAIAGGIFFVVVLLPRFGDAVGTVMYSSGEISQQTEGMKAAAKMASGDYEGAITEYEKMKAEQPTDPYPVSEIAKIYADKLHDPDRAVAYLHENLGNQEWTEDNAAFLMFRLVDVHHHAKAYDDAKAVLEQVVEHFPSTRHSANASHKITEIEQAQFKELRAQQNRSGNV